MRHSLSESDKLVLAIRTTTDEYRENVLSGPERLPRPFFQGDMRRITLCPDGIGPSQWLPGLVFNLVDGRFDVDLEAVSGALPPSPTYAYITDEKAPREAILRFPIRVDPECYWDSPVLEIAICNEQAHGLWKAFMAEVLVGNATRRALDGARRWDWMSMSINDDDLVRAEASERQDVAE